MSKPRFYPDHVIHWCIYLVLYPILTNSLIHNTCASLKGRGQVYGQKIVKKKLSDKRNTRYYLKIDIKKFYPSVNIDILIPMLERKIKDKKMMDLLIEILRKDKGLPIGMILSQLFANYYLYSLDHAYDYHTYIRYADDIVVFGSSKRDLRKLKRCLDDSLSELDLRMKDNWQVYKTDKEMLDFMGYRMDHRKVIMRKKIMYRFTKRIRQYSRNKSHRNASAVISYMGWVKNSNSWNFYNNRVKPYINFIEIKKIIRKGK